MPQEIERKFLVTSDEFKADSQGSSRIIQGYLSSGGGATVRVRVRDQQGYLTIKGKTLPGTFTRYEWETEIPQSDALELLQLCLGGVIDKIRYEVWVGNTLFEVDEFFGTNAGLIVAEVELKNETDTFELPHWIGEEVTFQSKYYNASLLRNPYTNW